jgi:multidrug efflux pump subunit AcrB
MTAVGFQFTLSDPIWRGLSGAIIAGLTFSGTIMLFFIPVVYYYFFRK